MSFFCIHDRIEFDGKYYYSNPISDMVNRYGDVTGILTCYAPIVRVRNSKNVRITRKDVNFVCAPEIRSIRDLSLIKKYYNKLKNYLANNDYAIIHIHASIINSLCVLAAENSNTPYVTVVVGCAWDALWNHSFKGKLMAPLCYLLEKWCQKKSKFSIYVTKSFLQSRYPTEGRYIACSNVELNFDGPAYPRADIDENCINIATVAAIDVKYKGQKYVIEALSKLKNSDRKFLYHLVGSGDDTSLKKYAKKLGVLENVIFHGPIPHSEIYNFLDTIEIYIQPSKQEGLPRSVIEAMSRGCLCLGSNIAGMPELIDSSFLFNAGDSDRIAQLLDSITKEDIINQGKLNIERAREYSKELLDKKRNKFIQNFRKESFS